MHQVSSDSAFNNQLRACYIRRRHHRLSRHMASHFDKQYLYAVSAPLEGNKLKIYICILMYLRIIHISIIVLAEKWIIWRRVFQPWGYLGSDGIVIVNLKITYKNSWFILWHSCIIWNHYIYKTCKHCTGHFVNATFVALSLCSRTWACLWEHCWGCRILLVLRI